LFKPAFGVWKTVQMEKFKLPGGFEGVLTRASLAPEDGPERQALIGVPARLDRDPQRRRVAGIRASRVDRAMVSAAQVEGNVDRPGPKRWARNVGLASRRPCGNSALGTKDLSALDGVIEHVIVVEEAIAGVDGEIGIARAHEGPDRKWSPLERISWRWPDPAYWS